MYLTKKEIKQLQKDLMCSNNNNSNIGRTRANSQSNNSSDKISTLVMKEVKKTKNSDIGLLFEENIRKTLELEYNWELADIPRKFFYRDIQFKGKSYLLTSFRQIEAKRFYIYMGKENNACKFINKSDEEEKAEIEENEKEVNYSFKNRNFIIGPPKEIEFDGIFSNFDSSVCPFNEEEIEVLFDNTNFYNYEYAVIEIKLNAQKITELIKQIKEDQKVMKRIVENDDVVYLGFINVNRNDYDYLNSIDFSKICPDFNCILFGIKNGILSKRNITFPVDWKLVEQFYSFKKEIKEEIQNLKKEIQNLKKETKDEIQNLKKETKDEIQNLKKEIKDFIMEELGKMK